MSYLVKENNITTIFLSFSGNIDKLYKCYIIPMYLHCPNRGKNMHDNENFNFKLAILNYLWEKRDKKLLLAKSNDFGLKNQKFLLFYNIFARLNGKKFDFNNLRAYKDGPVYFDIYSYIKNNSSTDVGYINTIVNYNDYIQDFDKQSLIASKLIVESMTKDQLSSLTHKFDFWSKNYYSNNQIKTISLKDITSEDEFKIKWIYDFCIDLSNNYEIYPTEKNVFFVKSEIPNYKNSSEFKQIIQNEYDYNPVVIDIDENGGIHID